MEEKPRPFTIAELLACAKRELDMRRRVYEFRVQNGKMRRANADKEIAMQSAIVELLEKQAGTERLL